MTHPTRTPAGGDAPPEVEPTSPRPQALVHHTRVAADLIEAAALIGLPLPSSINVTEWDDQPISLCLRSLADLTDWSRWLEVPIVDSVAESGSTHYTATGQVHGVTVRAFRVEVSS